MTPGKTAAARQQYLDRSPEFDQTAVTNTQADGFADQPPMVPTAEYAKYFGPKQSELEEPTPADFARPMPDVITRQNDVGHQIRQLANETHLSRLGSKFAAVTAERDDLQMRLDTAMLRIQGFEKLVQNFAEKFDEMNADCIFLTGRSFDEYLSDLNRERAQREHSIGGICRSPSPASPGLVCLRDKGHEGPCSTNPQPPPVGMDLTTPCQEVYHGQAGDFQCQLLSGHLGDHSF